MSAIVGPTGQISSLPSMMPDSPRPMDGRAMTTVSAQRSIQLTEQNGVTPAISFEDIYHSQPVVAALVNKLLRQISTLPLGVMKLNSQNEPQPVARDHDLAQLLRSPAPRRSALNLKQWIARPVLIHGNSLIAKFRGNGADKPPTNLLPLRWPYVSAFAQYGGPIEWWGTTQIGEWKWLPVAESVHFGWESDLGEIGISPLEQLGMVLKLEDAAQRYQVASLVNGARPSGAIVTPKDAKLDETDKSEMRADLRQMYEGVDNAFRVALLTGGAEWRPMSFSAVEAQLMEQRKVSRDEACMVFDVPPQLIGDLSRGTLSSVQEIHRMLYVTVLRPWLAFIEETLTAQLVDPEPEWADEGLLLRFDLAEVLRGNSDAEITAAAQAFMNGLITLNEARAKLGLAKARDAAGKLIAEADVPHIPVNNMAPITGGTPTGGPRPVVGGGRGPIQLPDGA
jgi:HK97 family phage portal protein